MGERGVLWCRTDLQGAFDEAGFGPDGRNEEESLPDADEWGKEPLGRLALRVTGEDGDGGRAVEALVRRFRHGGLAQVVTGRRFWDRRRPFVELRLSERLRELNIPTVSVLAARAVRARMFGYELALVTRRLPSAVDCGHLLGGVRRGDVERGELRAALRSAGQLVGAMHRIGFEHADLQPANILLASGRAHVLDLDRSRFHGSGPLVEERATRNLARLWRHVARREREFGKVLEDVDLALFLRSYGVERKELERRMRAIDRASQTAAGWHRTGWWLARVAGRKVDRRAAPTEL